MNRRYHSGRIIGMSPGQVFVFGSNIAGIHGAGAAKIAAARFGAQYGVGIGPTGRCYAIPTKDAELISLSLIYISAYVADFIDYARNHPDTEFLLTAIGCGLAKYKPKDIAPMFTSCPDNVIFPPEFRDV